VVGLAYEPHFFLGINADFIEYAINNIGKYFIGDMQINGYYLPLPFIPHLTYMWHNPPIIGKIYEKPKIMSIIFSHKQITSGHKYRHSIVEKILNSNLPIDIYGNGCQKYANYTDYRLKGEFVEYEPYDDYLFHITIENVQEPYYASEKVINPLLTNTTPIYLGCPNFLTDLVIPLSFNLEKDWSLIKNICENPIHYKIETNIEHVLDCVSFVRNLDKIFN